MDCSLVAGTDAIGAEWQALATRALVPSGHNSPELLLPALKQDSGARLAIVHDSEALRLAIPLASRRWPLPCHVNWSSPVNFHGLPHVDRDFAGPAITALLRKLRAPILFHSVPTGGPLWEALSAASGHMEVLARWERAVLRPSGSFEQWFEASFERKRRKEYRRLQARLSEQGRFEMLSLTPADDVSHWVDQFLSLEAAGWKGARGTAMKANPQAAATLREACRGLAAAGKLRFWKLALDDRPVAMLFAIVDGREAWLGKIAHDEELARFSPGQLLILHATERLFEEGLVQVDSCAIPDHPMINHLWRDRLPVADVMIAAPTVGAATFAMTVLGERLRRRLRTTARDIFYKLTGRHRS